MSRIHEALKKAEQERAASQGGQVVDASRVGELPGTELGTTMASVSTTAVPGTPAPTFSSQFTFDTLLARCGQATWHPDEKTMLFFSGQEHLNGMEEFRTLRSRLYQLREKMPLKKVLVSSSLPREGKSFVAANLAQVMVKQHGRRVLLIDADLRGSKLHTTLGTSSSPGLADYLLGESDEYSVMQRGLMENLFFVPSGRQVPSPAELLANFCDGVLLVVRSNVTPSDSARKARLEFREKQLVGVVLNGIEPDSSAYSRYYYGYDVRRGDGEGPR